MPPPPPTIPDFVADQLLAVGGYGAVWRGHRTSDDVTCAIKVARAAVGSAALRLRHEGRVLAQLKAPHVPLLLAQGEADGVPYLVLELIEGRTLAARLAQLPQPMPGKELRSLLLRTLDAVGAIHAAGVVHGDLKPENVMIRRSGEIAIIDFGTALALDVGQLSNDPVGTVEYMAPEQLEGKPIDERTDVYALGVIAFELLTLRPPFWGAAAEVRAACLSRRPPRPSTLFSVRRGFDDLVLKALVKDPAGRFESVAALRAAVAETFQRSHSTTGGVVPTVIGPSPSAIERARPRVMPIIAFELSHPNADEARRELERLEVKVVQVIGSRFVTVIDSDSTSKPLDHALGVARRVLALGLAERVVIEVAPVRAREVRDGRRYFSPSFQRTAHLLGVRAPAGVLLTPSAAEIAAVASNIRTRSITGTSDLVAVRSRIDPAFDDDTLGSTSQPFVGRTSMLAELSRSARDALESSTPTLMSVLGDPGLGKSRLASTLAHVLRSVVPGVHVLTIRGRDPALGDTGETLRVLLRQACRVAVEAPRSKATMEQRLVPHVADAWPAVGLALGWLSPDAPELASLANAPGALRLAIAQGLARALRRLATERPSCIVFDDAHFADATTLDALELATLAGTTGRLWICTVAGPSFDTIRPMWGDRAASSTSLRLTPLPDDRATELCRALLAPADNLPTHAVEVIARRAHGNPMLLRELVRALKSDGIVRQEPDGAWILETDRIDVFPDMPQVQWLTERQLRALSPELVAHAYLAATLGSEIPLPHLDRLLVILDEHGLGGQFPLDPRAAVTQLEAAGIVRTQSDRVIFRNALMRESISATIPDQLRRDLHRAAYELYRADDTLRWEQRTPLLARHALGAGLDVEAASACRALAEWHIEHHRYVEAEAGFTRTLEVVRDDAGQLASRHGRGIARYRVGRYADALDDFRTAEVLAQHLGDRAAEVAILLDHATALDWLANFRTSADLVEQAAGRAGDDLAAVLAARIEMGRARAKWRLGRRTDARDQLHAAVRAADAAGDVAYETLVVSLLMLGDVLGQLGEVREARDVFERILAVTAAHGDQLHEAAALNNRTTLWIAMGDAGRAVEDLQRFCEISRTLGTVVTEFYGGYNLGELLYLIGDTAASWPHVRRAVALAARRPDVMARPVARLLEARVLAYDGSWDDAARLSDAVATDHQRASAEGRVDAVLLPSEQLLLEAVQLACAGGSEAAWSDVRERSRRGSVEQHAIELIELQALGALRLGDVRAAGRLLDEALAVAHDIPNIMEPRLRRRRASL